jgi:hypothetical protein
MTSEDDQDVRSKFVPSMIMAVILQAVAVLSILSFTADLLRLDLSPFLFAALQFWRALSNDLMSFLGLSISSSFRDLLLVAIVVTSTTLWMWLRLQFRRASELRLRRTTGPGGIRLDQLSRTRLAFAQLAWAFLVTFARFIAAPLLSCMATLSVTMNFHLWVYQTYGLNYALSSAGMVIFATCLLLVVNLRRLIPGN